MKNPLQDKDFLYNLNQDRHKEIYAKIISLSFDEKPLEQIEGRVTSGSINIDGTSTVRRTCNLTLIAKDVNITDFYWGVSNKFTLEIGLKNNINKEYPNIIWFKQGIYVITSFNSSLTNSNYTISINGKDKMCLLNGEIGGNLPSSIDFGKIDNYEDTYTEVKIKDYTQYVANKYYIYENGEYKISLSEFNEKTKYYTKDILLKQDSLKLKDIIKEAVHEYGKELYHNIIINDLDNYGLELLEYRGDKPLYLLYDEAAHIYTQMVIDEDFSIGNDYTISTCPQYNNAIDSLNDGRYIFTLEDGKKYSATKVEYGATAGYRTTDLTYPGDLISSVGESLTSILDKIKNTIGAFEYFYDIDGRFIFQAKKIYSQNSWNTLVNADNNIFARDVVEESPYSYSFEDVNLIQQFQNTPAINNVKNDYSIWGTRKGVTGAEIPIHARYAIQNKPKYYKAYDEKIYFTDLETFNILKENAKDTIKQEVISKVRSFEPKYPLPIQLKAPTRQPNGDWSPGWWNIKDWYDYYVLLTGEEPNYTMKWYSQNSAEGCLRLLDVFPDSHYTSPYYRNRYVWLVVMSPDGNISSVNIQHGSGSPYDSGYECTLHKSYTDGEGRVITERVEPVTKKYFIPPFSGCSDTHTYLEFLKNDAKNGNEVYFYNPAFPDFTFDEAIEEKIEKEYEDYLIKGILNLVDWREIIYQMAKDYYKHGQEADFFFNVAKNNIKLDGINSYYPTGQTGYEIFYSDIQGFWRQLYDPNPDIIYDTEGGYYSEEKEYEPDGVTYKIKTVWNPFKEKDTFTCDYYLKGENETDDYSATKYYWNKNVVLAPEQLNFWIDFYDGNDSLMQYSIAAIGDRPKVVNDSKITSIYFRNVPQVIFTNGQDYNGLDIKTGYTYIWLDKSMQDLFSISAQGKSAEEEMNELFNNYSYCSEGVTITAVPIYNLEPNTLVYIYNEENKINGKYQVNRITIPLNYNGMMSITATKIIEQVY